MIDQRHRSVRPQTENDLRWYFGCGQSTAIGDVGGLQSSLGPQLDLIQSGSVGGSGAGMYTDALLAKVSSREDAVQSIAHMHVHRRVAAVGRLRGIEKRLIELESMFRGVLRAHYGLRPIGRGLSAAAVFVPSVQALYRDAWDRSLKDAKAEKTESGWRNDSQRMPQEISVWLDRLPLQAIEPIVGATNVAVRNAAFAYEDASK